MKLSISLPDEDVAFLDSYASTRGFPSRSAALRRAIRLLRGSELSAAYEDAFATWEDRGEAGAWDPSTADGLDDDSEG